MKSKVNKLDFDKLVPVSVHLSKLSDVVKNDVVKKDAYIAKITTATTALTAVENEIPNFNNLVKQPYYNSKISEIEKKISDLDHDKYITTPEFNKLKVH